MADTKKDHRIKW